MILKFAMSVIEINSFLDVLNIGILPVAGYRDGFDMTLQVTVILTPHVLTHEKQQRKMKYHII